MASFDSVVVGGGVIGTGAALALQKNGHKTVLLEQFPLPHTRGSSTGHSRITRIANYRVPAMTPIMLSSQRMWREIERETGTQLLLPDSMYCVGNRQVNMKVKADLVKNGMRVQEFSPQQFNSTFGTSFSAGCSVVTDPSAGVLKADLCIATMRELFKKHGGTVLCEWPVTRVEPTSRDSVTVHGKGGSIIKAKRAVICAGPWTSNLLKHFGLQLPLVPGKALALYWKKKVPESRFPVFVTATSGGDPHFYGLPTPEYPGLVKISQHMAVPCDPDYRDREDAGHIIESTKRFIKTNFPNLESEPAIVESCIYTLTPDEDMILDKPVGCPNIAYACGFSGTGFKVGPGVGRLLCQMVTGSKLDHDISSFAATRFSSSKL